MNGFYLGREIVQTPSAQFQARVRIGPSEGEICQTSSGPMTKLEGRGGAFASGPLGHTRLSPPGASRTRRRAAGTARRPDVRASQGQFWRARERALGRRQSLNGGDAERQAEGGPDDGRQAAAQVLVAGTKQSRVKGTGAYIDEDRKARSLAFMLRLQGSGLGRCSSTADHEAAAYRFQVRTPRGSGASHSGKATPNDGGEAE